MKYFMHKINLLFKTPRLHTVKYVESIIDLGERKYVDGVYHPKRPYSDPSISKRFKYAWMVFTGKADALEWPGDQ